MPIGCLAVISNIRISRLCRPITSAHCVAACMCFSLFVVVLHGATGIGSDRLGGSDSLSSFKLHSIQFAAFKMENVAQLNAVAQQSILSLRCDAEFAPSVQ